MTEQEKQTYVQAFAHWFQGRHDAIMLAISYLTLVHVWDDLWDQDTHVSRETIDRAFCSAMIDIPKNEFWRAHCSTLIPAFETVWLQWHAANALEAGDARDREKAFVLRAGIYGLFCHMALLVGGRDHALAMAPNIWRLYGETLESFSEEMRGRDNA